MTTLYFEMLVTSRISFSVLSEISCTLPAKPFGTGTIYRPTLALEDGALNKTWKNDHKTLNRGSKPLLHDTRSGYAP